MNAALQPAVGRCDGRWRHRPYRELLDLRGGRQVLLRPIHRSDAADLSEFFSALSPRSRHSRFHGAVNRLPDDALRHLTTQVAQQHVAVVAVGHTDDGQPRLVAEARYVADTAEPGRAEFALTVADAWQGLGLGRALLQRLAVHASMLGLLELEGSVLADNRPMLGLLQALGAHFRSRGGEVRATLML